MGESKAKRVFKIIVAAALLLLAVGVFVAIVFLVETQDTGVMSGPVGGMEHNEPDESSISETEQSEESSEESSREESEESSVGESENMSESEESSSEQSETDEPYITRDGTLWKDSGYPMSIVWNDNRVWGTQEDLDSFNRLIHSDKIAYIDVSFTGGGGGDPMSIPLPAEYADAIWRIFLSLDIEVITQHENIATGGAEYITAYDELGNILFCVVMPGGPISIKYPGEPTIIEFAAGDKYEIRELIYQCISEYDAANK